MVELGGVAMLRFVIGIGLVVMTTACSQPKSDKSRAQTAQSATKVDKAEMLDPDWVYVAVNSENRPIYVNSNSIYRYKEGPFTMAEIAIGGEKGRETQYTGFVQAFDCKSRLRVVLPDDGSETSPTPVESWTLHADIYNFVCFGKVRARYTTIPHSSSLNVDSFNTDQPDQTSPSPS